MTRRMLQTVGLLVFLLLIVGLVTALSRPGSQPHSASALNSPLPPPAETPDAIQLIPVPREYFPTPIPKDQRADFSPEWVTYEIPGEGLTFRARRDWPISSGKAATMKYSIVRIVFWDTGGGVGMLQANNPKRLALRDFAKTQETAFGSPHNEKWLSANISDFSRDISDSRYQRLLIVRDDSDKSATATINGLAKYTVLIAYDQRVLITRSPEDMSPEVEQHFWEVIDSIIFSPIQ